MWGSECWAGRTGGGGTQKRRRQHSLDCYHDSFWCISRPNPLLYVHAHSYWPMWAENHLHKSVDLCYIVTTRKACSSLYRFCWHQHISCSWKFIYQIDKFCLWFSDCENGICNIYEHNNWLEFCCSTTVSLSHSDKRRCSFAVHIYIGMYCYVHVIGSPA